MAVIKPFRALRYDFEKAGAPGRICCPPYDIIPEKQREDLLRESDYNVIRLELPQGENRYEAAAQTLLSWQREGVLREDAQECLYIYEEEFTVGGERRKINGIVSRVMLEEFSKGIILPHEETLSKAKADRFDLMSSTYCNFSQIYSLYHDESGEISRLTAAAMAGTPEVEFTAPDGIIHRVWPIADKTSTDKICRAFEGRRLYIADGHHRYETALKFRDSLKEKALPAHALEQAGFVMMMLVEMDHPGLVVLPTHRLIKGVAHFDEKDVLAGVSNLFEVERAADAGSLERALINSEKTLAFYSGENGCYLFRLKPDVDVKALLPGMSEAYCSLDVTLLHALILEPVLGIDKENMLRQTNLSYTRDMDEAVRAVDDKQAQCAFLLNATRVGQIRDVSLAGEKMPQKSTYFYPKLITGLIMNKIMDIPE